MAKRLKNQAAKDPKEQPSQVKSPEEKRRYIRTIASVSLALHYKDNGDIEEARASTRNISATGMMVEINKRLPIGKELDIMLNAPDSSNPIHCKGVAVWSAPLQVPGKYSCGIEFTRIEEDNKNSFLKFLCDAIYKISGNP